MQKRVNYFQKTFKKNNKKAINVLFTSHYLSQDRK